MKLPQADWCTANRGPGCIFAQEEQLDSGDLGRNIINLECVACCVLTYAIRKVVGMGQQGQLLIFAVGPPKGVNSSMKTVQ